GRADGTTDVVVRGALRAAHSDIYFTDTNHQHSAIGNTAGFAAIENASDPEFNALMILGRQTTQGRIVKVWDYLEVNGNFKTTGTITIGTVTSPISLLNTPNPPGAGSIRLGDWLLRTNGNTLELVHAPPAPFIFVPGGSPAPSEKVVARFLASATGANRLTFP
ncbi:MAG: hypothetical protein ACKO6F_07395, partial [Cyanobium sp.]